MTMCQYCNRCIPRKLVGVHWVHQVGQNHFNCYYATLDIPGVPSVSAAPPEGIQHPDYGYNPQGKWVRKTPVASAAPQGASAMLADDILRRIAKRYANCEVRIYPDLPELTPVEAVLRCAQAEGFILTNVVLPAPLQASDRERAFDEWFSSPKPAGHHGRYELAKLAWTEGLRRGQEEMRERAAKSIETASIRELGEGATRLKAAAAVRALPLTKEKL